VFVFGIGRGCCEFVGLVEFVVTFGVFVTFVGVVVVCCVSWSCVGLVTLRPGVFCCLCVCCCCAVGVVWLCGVVLG